MGWIRQAYLYKDVASRGFFAWFFYNRAASSWDTISSYAGKGEVLVRGPSDLSMIEWDDVPIQNLKEPIYCMQRWDQLPDNGRYHELSYSPDPKIRSRFASDLMITLLTDKGYWSVFLSEMFIKLFTKNHHKAVANELGARLRSDIIAYFGDAEGVALYTLARFTKPGNNKQSVFTERKMLKMILDSFQVSIPIQTHRPWFFLNVQMFTYQTSCSFKRRLFLATRLQIQRSFRISFSSH